MRRLPQLLRLTLCFALMANAVVTVVAATRMAAAHAESPSRLATDPTPPAEPPCHDESGEAAHPPEAAPEPVGVGPDCCGFGACQCACAHQLVAAVSLATLARTAAPSIEQPRSPALRHPEPRLQRLTRPPIV